MRIALPDSSGLDRLWRGSLLTAVLLLPFPGVLPEPLPGTAMRWSDLALAAALAAYVAWRVLGGGVRLAGWQWAGVGYAAWAGVSWLAHGGTAAGGLKVLGVVSLAGTAVLAAAFGPAARLARVVAVGVIASAGLAVIGLLAHALGFETTLVGMPGDLVPGSWARARAGFTHPNLGASFALFAYGALAWERSPRLRRLAQVAAAVVAVTAFSRSLLSLLALPLLAAGGRRARAAAATVAAALVLLTVVRVDVDPSAPWQAQRSRLGSPRAIAFGSALQSLAGSPLTGVGPGVLPAAVDGFPFDAHCTPLSVAASYGLPALGLFAAASLGAWRASPSASGRAMIAALLLDGLAADVEDFRHFWLAMGLAQAAPAPPRET